MTEETAITVNRKDHAESIDKAIKNIRDTLKEGFWNMCQLLAMMFNEKLFLQLGYNNFNDYVSLSGLDVNSSTAYRMVKLSNMVEDLNIPKEKLLQIKPSKLLEIASLDRKENKKDILDLIEKGTELSINEVRDHVRKTKGIDGTVMMTFKFERTTYEEVVEPAFEKVRTVAGSIVDEQTGEVIEISDSKVLEFLCTEYLHTPVDEERPFIEQEEE